MSTALDRLETVRRALRNSEAEYIAMDVPARKFGLVGLGEFLEAAINDVRAEITMLQIEHTLIHTEILRRDTEIGELRERKDRAYSERNALAIGFAKMARLAGLRAGHGYDNDPEKGWDPEWLHVVYAELPDGRQVSWHVGPDMVDRAVALGEYGKPWDGTAHGRDLSWCEFAADSRVEEVIEAGGCAPPVIAPAEAKGDVAGLDVHRCDCGPGCERIVCNGCGNELGKLPQPAGGEAVFVVDHVGTSYGSGPDKPTVLVGHSAVLNALTNGARLYAEPPAAQVQQEAERQFFARDFYEEAHDGKVRWPGFKCTHPAAGDKVRVTDEMVGRLCKALAMQMDGAEWPNAYSDLEVEQDREWVRVALEAALAQPQSGEVSP